MLGAGAEALAAYALKEDLRTRAASQTGAPPVATQDHPGETWTQTYGPVEIADDVALEAKLEDDSGKFNLNSLVNDKDEPDLIARQVFERLLETLGLEARWAPLVIDFIDANTNATPNGGEDNAYTLQKPGYRAPNTWITSPSELLALPEFGRERYLKLLPHVTALPPEYWKINVCFATPELLDAIESVFDQKAIKQYANARDNDAESFRQSRSSGCFPPLSALGQGASTLEPAMRSALQAGLVDQSTYFRLHTWISIGTTRFALYSLLRRENQQVVLVYRTFGTE